MPREVEQLSTVVFASYKTSLSTWRRAGIQQRELRYIELLSEQLGPMTLLTYDGRDSANGHVAIKGRPRLVPSALYSVLSPFLHWKTLRRADVFRANQLRGAWTAALASMVHRKPLVLRTGYVWSQFKEADGGRGLRLRLALMLERFALRRASVVITASEADRARLIELHGVALDKIHVVPNPVDTEMFAPAKDASRRPGLVTYVGRLEPQKQVHLLIEAMGLIPGAALRIIGDGSLRSQFEQQAKGLDVEFTGTVPNEQLPNLLSETTVFVLPSRFEGTPKALLEAMASECAVVTTGTSGTADVVTDNETGLIAEPEPQAIAEAINALLSNPSLRTRLGASAREYVLQRHSMENGAATESALIRLVVDQSGQLTAKLNTETTTDGSIR